MANFNYPLFQRDNVTGTTLLELLVVLAIVGILLTISIPSYSRYIAIAKRTELLTELTRLANLQEEYFAEYASYSTSLTAVFQLPEATPNSPIYSYNKGVYFITVSSADWQAEYKLIATAQGGQVNLDSQCYAISLDSYQQRHSKNIQGDDTSSSCW